MVTTGGDLPAGYVIHTVGPVWRGGGNNEEQLLTDAYWNSLKLSTETGISTIAFPAISCGVYAYPVEEAAAIARSVTLERAWPLQDIRFVLFSEDVHEAWVRAFA